MNNYFKIKKYHFFLIVFFVLIWASCKVEAILPVAESVKDLSGSWKVIKITRNGTDLTSIIDLTQFRVKFDASGNYTLLNPLPFIVNKDGKYALDDPKYPFKISFTAIGAQPATTAFNYLIVGGIRQLNLTFSPGCILNSYVYTLVKE